jgi:hypothetical protein
MRIDRRYPNAGVSKARARPAERQYLFVWYLLSALGLMATFVLLSAHPARAAGEVEIDEGGAVVDAEATGGGMPSSNPRVRPILAAHPGQSVVICVAGCDGKPRAVQVLAGPVTARVGGYLPSMAKMGTEAYGPPSPAGRQAATQDNDVVCLAGCTGRPGQVLQRVSDLPPIKVKPAKRERSKEKRDAPLDIDP